jgi:hypothetical protein
MIPMEKQQTEGRLFHHSALPGGVVPLRRKKRGRRRKQLLDDVKEKRRYWNLTGSTKSHSGEIELEKATILSQDKQRNGLLHGGVTVRSVGRYCRVSELERMWHQDVVTKYYKYGDYTFRSI